MREYIIRAVAGTLVLTGAILAITIHTNWLWVDVFVGFNLLQSSFTHFCPLEIALKKLNIPSSGSTSVLDKEIPLKQEVQD